MKKPQDSFAAFIISSLLLHGIVLTLLTVKILFFPASVDEHKQAVRIDVVALPEKQTELPKPPTSKPEVAKEEPPKPEVKPDPPKPKPKPKPKIPKPKPKPMLPKPKKPDPEKVKDEQESALDRLKALQKLKDQKKDQNPIKKIEYKGNQISKGNSLTGIEKLHHDNYLDSLDGHIRNYWNLPEWLANGNLKASIILFIDKNGGVINKVFVLKSGNDLFDQQVIGTIDKANPLPAPPANLVDYYTTKGIELRFPE